MADMMSRAESKRLTCLSPKRSHQNEHIFLKQPIYRLCEA